MKGDHCLAICEVRSHFDEIWKGDRGLFFDD
jgi:hypothetical protein